MKNSNCWHYDISHCCHHLSRGSSSNSVEFLIITFFFFFKWSKSFLRFNDLWRGTIGAFPKCLSIIKKNLASEVLWKKKKKHHLNQPLFRSRWFYSVYNQSHCTKCIAEAGLQNWLWEHCEHWAHMTRAVWVFPDVSVTSGGNRAASGDRSAWTDEETEDFWSLIQQL